MFDEPDPVNTIVDRTAHRAAGRRASGLRSGEGARDVDVHTSGTWRREHCLILITEIVAVIGAGGEEHALSARPSRLFLLLGDFAWAGQSHLIGNPPNRTRRVAQAAAQVP